MDYAELFEESYDYENESEKDKSTFLTTALHYINTKILPDFLDSDDQYDEFNCSVSYFT